MYASPAARVSRPLFALPWERSCLNEMVTDALQHIPDVFSYLAAIKNQTVFNFCAIPQVMAISTLALCFDNHQIFKGVVKIRKGALAIWGPRVHCAPQSPVQTVL